MLETKSPTPEAARAAESAAEAEWRKAWAANEGRCRSEYRDLQTYLTHRRQEYRAAAIVGSRQVRGAAQ